MQIEETHKSKHKPSFKEEESTDALSFHESSNQTVKEKNSKSKQNYTVPTKPLEGDLSYDSSDYKPSSKQVKKTSKIQAEESKSKMITHEKKAVNTVEREKAQDSLISALNGKIPGGNKVIKGQNPYKSRDARDEDDVSFNSDNDNLSSRESTKTKSITTNNLSLQSQTTTKEGKIKEKEPVYPNKPGSKATKPSEVQKQSFLEDDHSYKSDDSDEDPLALKKKVVEKINSKDKKQEGKSSLKKIEQEVDFKLTNSSMAKIIQNKKLPIISERKASIETEDLGLSDPEQRDSLIKKTGWNSPKIFERKDSDKGAMEIEFNNTNSNSNSYGVTTLISAMHKKMKNEKADKNGVKKVDDSWNGIAPSHFNQGRDDSKDGIQRKARAVQITAADDDDLLVNFEDDPLPAEDNQFITRFKKQKVSQSVTYEDFQSMNEKSNTTATFREIQSQGGMKRQKAQQVVNNNDPLDLIESPLHSPKQIISVKKEYEKGSFYLRFFMLRVVFRK